MLFAEMLTGVHPFRGRGPQAYLIRGVLEQNVIFHVMADALGLGD